MSEHYPGTRQEALDTLAMCERIGDLVDDLHSVQLVIEDAGWLDVLGEVAQAINHLPAPIVECVRAAQVYVERALQLCEDHNPAEAYMDERRTLRRINEEMERILQ